MNANIKPHQLRNPNETILSQEDVERMKENFRQVDAIFALEEFEPTEQSRAIDAAVLAGRVTEAQVIEEMREYAIKHKTTRGFIESRAWA
jgi:hypothetical protein